jgi:hypothetical protein
MLGEDRFGGIQDGLACALGIMCATANEFWFWH